MRNTVGQVKRRKGKLIAQIFFNNVLCASDDNLAFNNRFEVLEVALGLNVVLGRLFV